MTLKRIQLHDKHVALGAKMVPFAGYEMPIKYSSETAEHMAVRNAVGIFDVSHMGEFFVTGKEAERFVQSVTSNDITRLDDGQALYSCLTNERGGVIDDLLVYRFSLESYMLVVNASNIDKDWSWLVLHSKKHDVKLEDKSSDYSLFAVQGPKATELLQQLTEVKLEKIPYYTFTEDNMAGVEGVIISATGYTGAGGFELYVRNEQAEKLFDAILEKGEKYDLMPIGLGARDTLRLEMGYCLHGHELNDEITPLEAGLGWVTKLKTDFIGVETLRIQKEQGLSRKLVAFELLERGIPRQGYDITIDGSKVGEVTSGTMSPVLKQGIGMGFMKASEASQVTEVGVKIRNKILKARLVKLPFITKTN